MTGPSARCSSSPGRGGWSGRDGDGDGRANPQSLVDAATAAGVYLCSGQGNLRTRDGAYSAVLRYNHSDDYAKTVLSIAQAYRSGVTVVPMGSIPAARPAEGSGTRTPEGSGFGWGGASAAPHPPRARHRRRSRPRNPLPPRRPRVMVGPLRRRQRIHGPLPARQAGPAGADAPSPVAYGTAPRSHRPPTGLHLTRCRPAAGPAAPARPCPATRPDSFVSSTPRPGRSSASSTRRSSAAPDRAGSRCSRSR